MDTILNVGEERYLHLLRRILEEGNAKTDRTGVGTRSLFGAQLRFDLQDGSPLLTTKKIFTKGVFAELAWLIRGETNVRWLQERGVHIWDEWADENGDLGPVYGKQWRDWSGERWTNDGGDFKSVDQLQNALDLIRKSPDSRRIVVSAWSASDLDEMALQPCHVLFQFEVHDGELSCHMYQRSSDVFLGVPFNIASYAALTHFMAAHAGLEVGELIISFGDVHIYNNHIDQVREQLTRVPRALPFLRVDPRFWKSAKIDDSVDYEDFIVVGYDPHPAIKAPVAV